MALSMYTLLLITNTGGFHQIRTDGCSKNAAHYCDDIAPYKGYKPKHIYQAVH